MPRERRHWGRYPRIPFYTSEENARLRSIFNKTGQLPKSVVEQKQERQVEWLCLVCDNLSKHKSTCTEEDRTSAVVLQQLSRISNMDGIGPSSEEGFLTGTHTSQLHSQHAVEEDEITESDSEAVQNMQEENDQNTRDQQRNIKNDDVEGTQVTPRSSSISVEDNREGILGVSSESANLQKELEERLMEEDGMLQLEDNDEVNPPSRGYYMKETVGNSHLLDNTRPLYVDESLFPSLSRVWNALKTTLPIMQGLKRKHLVPSATFQQLWPDYCRRLPDPLRVANPTSEHFFCEGSEIGVVDVGMFWPQLFEAELLKCPWCTMPSSPEAPIQRSSFRAGFMVVRTLEGRLKFLKVAQYKHINCPNAMGQGKKGLLFGALHPTLFMQYHALVQRKLGSLVLKRPFVPSECVELLGGTTLVVKRAFKNLDRLHRQIFATEMAVRERMQEQYNNELLYDGMKADKSAHGGELHPTFFSDSDTSFVGLLTEIIGRPTAITRSMGVQSLTHLVYTQEEKFLFRSMLLSTQYVRPAKVSEYSAYLNESEEKLCIALSKSKANSRGGPSRPLDWINFDAMAVEWAKLWQKAEVTADFIPATVNGEEKQLDHSRVFLKSSEDLRQYALRYAKGVVTSLRTSPGSMTLSAAIALQQIQALEQTRKRPAGDLEGEEYLSRHPKKKLLAPPCPVCGEAMRRGGKHASNCQFKFYQTNYHNKDAQFGFSRASSKQSMVAAALHAWHNLEERDRSEIERHMLEVMGTKQQQHQPNAGTDQNGNRTEPHHNPEGDTVPVDEHLQDAQGIQENQEEDAAGVPISNENLPMAHDSDRKHSEDSREQEELSVVM